MQLIKQKVKGGPGFSKTPRESLICPLELVLPSASSPFRRCIGSLTSCIVVVVVFFMVSVGDLFRSLFFTCYPAHVRQTFPHTKNQTTFNRKNEASAAARGQGKKPRPDARLFKTAEKMSHRVVGIKKPPLFPSFRWKGSSPFSCLDPLF